MAEETVSPKADELIRSFLPAEAAWITGDHWTANPDGVTVSNHDYYPKTQEEKAELLNVEFAQSIDNYIDPFGDNGRMEDQPYPDGDLLVQSEEDRLRYLARMHSPMELVQADDMAEQQEKNLRAGGSVPMEEVMSIAKDAVPEEDEHRSGVPTPTAGYDENVAP